MSSFNLAKKLRPAKKAWRSLTNKLQSKLHNLNFSKALKKLAHRLIAFRPIRRLIPRKLRSPNHHHRHHHHPHLSAAIFVDELFPEPASSSGANKAKVEATKMNMQKQKQEHLPPQEGKCTVSDAWNINATFFPQLRGVDERAEEFISKFRQDMKIQREQSILDYQEMLARGL